MSNNKILNNNKSIKQQRQMQSEKTNKQRQKLDSEEEGIEYIQSDKLLILEQRQIVRHMLIVKDWIILSIYTPNKQNNKHNFYKNKYKSPAKDIKQKITQTNNYSKGQNNKYHPQNYKQRLYSDQNNKYNRQINNDITQFVSVLAIRTETKSQINLSDKNKSQINNQLNRSDNKQNNKNKQDNKNNNKKQSISEIKMLHKQARVQNIIQWKPSSQFIDNNIQINQLSYVQNKISKLMNQPKYFIILSYTKIQLYKVQSIKQQQMSQSIEVPTNISLINVFNTQFIIPYNIIKINNQTQQSKNINENIKENEQYRNKMRKHLKEKQKSNKYQLIMVGIDRQQTFWSQYYQISNIKRNIYLFKNDFIQDNIMNKNNGFKQTKQKKLIQQKQNVNKMSRLRRVKSAQNILLIMDSKLAQDDKQQKQKLSSTQFITRANTFDNQLNNSPDKYSFNSPNKYSFKSDNKSNSSSFNSPNYKTTSNYDKQSFNSLSNYSDSPNKNNKSTKQQVYRNKIKNMKQPEYKRKQQKQRQKQKLYPIQIQIQKKIQLYPQLFQSSKNQIYSNQQKQIEQYNKNKNKGYNKVNRFYYYINGSNKCNPPLQHVHYFYAQTLVQIQYSLFKREINKNKQNKKRYRKEKQLMMLIGYINNVVLLNVEKQQIISRVELDRQMAINKMITIYNMFGIYTAIVLTNHIQIYQQQNNNNKQSKQIYKNNKLIKITVDSINNRQIGIGLQQLKSPYYQSINHYKLKELNDQIININPIYDQQRYNKIKQIQQLIKLQQQLKMQEQQRQNELKQSYQQVLDLIPKQQIINKYQQQNQKDNQRRQLNRLNKCIKIDIQQLKYYIIINTNTGISFLYNHITNKYLPLYNLNHNHNNKNQNTLSSSTNQSNNTNQLVKFYNSVNKTTTTHLQIVKQNNQHHKLKYKLSIIYSKSVQQSSHPQQHNKQQHKSTQKGKFKQQDKYISNKIQYVQSIYPKIQQLISITFF